MIVTLYCFALVASKMPDEFRDRLLRTQGYAEQLAAGMLPETTLEDVTDALVITDGRLDEPGPTILFANAAFERLTGYDRDELTGRSPRMLQGYDTDRVELDRMKQVLRRGEVFEGSVLNYRKSRVEYVVGWTIAPVRDANGDIRRWISVQNDVLAEQRAGRSA